MNTVSAPKKEKPTFICTSCQLKTGRWEGRCPRCKEWNSFIESHSYVPNSEVLSKNITLLLEEKDGDESYLTLNWPQLNRVLGGGFVAGSMVLLAGEPGVGKSTLIIRLLKSLNEMESALYVSGEESIKQTAQRASRLGLKKGNIRFLSHTDINVIINEAEALGPSIVIIDSIQTLMNRDLLIPAGSVGQVKEVTQTLITKLKRKSITCLVIGHISKDGNIAGPKVLEHMVDVVLYFETLKNGYQRSLRCKKNRFGSTCEEGIFEMTEYGLEDYCFERSIKSASLMLPKVGKLYLIVRRGSRPLIYEVQALVVKSVTKYGKRVAKGIETNRFSIIIALLEKELKLDLSNFDIYLEVIGESKGAPEELDLAIAGALYSAYCEKVGEPMILLSGKLKLNGEIQANPENEIEEVASRGFRYGSFKRLREIKDFFINKAS